MAKSKLPPSQDPTTPPDTLQRMARTSVQRKVGLNPNTPVAVLLRMAQKDVSLVLGNPVLALLPMEVQDPTVHALLCEIIDHQTDELAKQYTPQEVTAWAVWCLDEADPAVAPVDQKMRALALRYAAGDGLVWSQRTLLIREIIGKSPPEDFGETGSPWICLPSLWAQDESATGMPSFFSSYWRKSQPFVFACRSYEGRVGCYERLQHWRTPKESYAQETQGHGGAPTDQDRTGAPDPRGV